MAPARRALRASHPWPRASLQKSGHSQRSARGRGHYRAPARRAQTPSSPTTQTRSTNPTLPQRPARKRRAPSGRGGSHKRAARKRGCHATGGLSGPRPPFAARAPRCRGGLVGHAAARCCQVRAGGARQPPTFNKDTSLVMCSTFRCVYQVGPPSHAGPVRLDSLAPAHPGFSPSSPLSFR
ncbi:MAG: hypothetical protein J3K34DRAFT_255476 [Monoraphidium minutum]|nr:MAG: hypothetical protein J3K34DRAFT_255476 [Monoraphidium minutum]